MFLSVKKCKIHNHPITAFVAECALPLWQVVTDEIKSKKEGGNRIMKKFLSLIAALCVMGLAITSVSYAADNDNAYVVVRCTVDVSVDVLDNSTTVYIGTYNSGNWDAGPNSIYVSTYVVVRNSSLGAITKWQLAITGQEQSASPYSGYAATDGTYPAWTYGTTLDDVGPNKVAIAAVFKSAAATDSDFGDNDVLDTGGKYYKTTNLTFGPESNSYSTAVESSNNYNMISPYPNADSDRNLYFRVHTPSAVTDERYRKIQVTITASLGL